MQAPRHPYTQALLSAVPEIDRLQQRSVIRLEGDMPSPANPPGVPFSSTLQSGYRQMPFRLPKAGQAQSDTQCQLLQGGSGLESVHCAFSF